MNKATPFCAVLLIASVGAWAQDFSVEGGGPSGAGGATIFEKDGDTVSVAGGDAGTGTADPDDEIDALSEDRTVDTDDDGVTFCFSVDENADGVRITFVPGYNVPHQSMRNQEAGDAYITTEAFDLQTGILPPPISLGEFDNVLAINQARGWADNTGFGLIPNITPNQFFPPPRPIDNVDGLAELVPGPIAGKEAFFTLRNGSPSLETLPGPPNLNRGADIFYDPDITTGGNEQLFIQTPQLGLIVGDDIDALVVLDRNHNRQYEPNIDVIFFSLAPGSPTLQQLNASPSDVFIRSPAGFNLFAQFDQSGLGFDDNMNALHFMEVINGSVEETIRSIIPRPKFARPSP